MAARTPEEIAAFCQAVDDHWLKTGSRRSQVRDILARLIAAQSSPFTADQLLAWARAVDRLISQASVYRTLASLVEGGLVREAPGPHNLRCYAPSDAPGGGVGNIVCTDCDQVVPLADECLPLREGFLARQLGFNPKKMTLRIEASCEELRRLGSCHRCKPEAGPRS